MKKTKLIALLLVVSMMALAIIPVSATYDPTIRAVGNIPDDVWYIAPIYHWVVRGETLQGIADRYGTNTDELRFYNYEYFTDLANRNKTTGVDVQLEHGVRLFIYHMVTVKHYVRRDDTLWNLANGRLQNGSFTLKTTIPAIKAQNANWFASLDRLNDTRNSGAPHELEESYDMWNVWYEYFDEDRYPTTEYEALKAIDEKRLESPTMAGAPLYISVPVQISPGEDEYVREVWTYIANKGESEGNPALALEPSYTASKWSDFSYYNGFQVPFPNTFPTNQLLPRYGYEPGLEDKLDLEGEYYAGGWIRAIMGYKQSLSLANYQIPGWYGIRATDYGVWW